MKRYKPLSMLAMALMLTLPVAKSAEEAGDKPTQPQPPAHSHRGPKKLMLENSDGAKITLWKPDLTTQPLTFEHGGITIPKTGTDNYHVVIAEKDWGDSKEAVIRYEYQFGRPSKRSPSELAGTEKTAFEIVPDPIPREHNHYHSDQTWGFLLRIHGAPAVGIPVSLETDNGSQMQASTDESGRVAFHLPDDFPDIVTGERDRRSAELAISAVIQDGDIDYQTTLTAEYRVAPSHWQSTRMGLLVAGLGLIVGGLIGKTKKTAGKKA
ncbi:MAG: hypothetical protein KZQ80_16905 [Candidatus Thiodiazotropha sp. (ex Monitilora ramsayi)]|nr:hypothetical protein [Candidatus Thiodiazotropha sp. (ex Monitilora ramsayi)]